MMVSVVIPVYNVEKYLVNCLDSVMDQKYKDFEVILVDDGSTDRSPLICDDYVRRDSRFQVIHQKNGGLSHARNVGAKAAKGDYIFFLDSDDCIHPLLLYKMTELARTHKAAMVQIDIEQVPEDFRNYKKDVDEKFEVYVFDTIEAFYNIDKDNQSIAKDIRLVTLVAWSKLYRRDLLERISFPEDIKLHEDQMVAHRFIVEAGGMVFCRAPLYFYRNRQGSLITEGWTVKRLTIFECYKDRVEWAKKVNGNEEEVRELVYYIFIRYLVCMFKNYWMASRKLLGKEKKRYQKQIVERFREELKGRPFSLKLKDWLIYNSFAVVPGLFVGCYQAVYSLKQLIKR